MNIEKRGKDKYRIRMMVDRKIYSVTVSHKPTEKEAYELIFQKIDDDIGLKGTFKNYANQYISVKENVISPRTEREYINMVRLLPEWFTSLDLGEIRQSDVQKVINDLSVEKSPKTVRNYHGFIASVITMFRPGFILNTTLPQKVKKDNYIPTNEDIKRIIEYANNTEYSIALKLAALGLRRSEVCALTQSDIDENNVLHINKAYVMDKNGEWVIKSTKTTASTRDIPIPDQLANEIREKGYIYKYHPNNIAKFLYKAQKDLDIPQFSLHKFRHFCVSMLSDMNVPVATIMSLCGYETDAVMKSVYQHNMKQEDEQRIIMGNLTSNLF